MLNLFASLRMPNSALPGTWRFGGRVISIDDAAAAGKAASGRSEIRAAGFAREAGGIKRGFDSRRLHLWLNHTSWHCSRRERPRFVSSNVSLTSG